jgi:two-component system chemotaxis response regulator CheY
MYKILVVDDIATNRRVLKLILSELENVDFFDAENGEDAIAMTNDHQPDIIFMDIMMPKMDGIEATRIIKQNPLHQKYSSLQLLHLMIIQ